MSRMNYIGRFAPSPSGALHMGSLVAALASFLDARAHDGVWLVRMEDLDAPRVVPGAAELILSQLRALGLRWDGEVLVQSDREAVYRTAFDTLAQQDLIYGCSCTRKEIADSVIQARGVLPTGEVPYPGICRHGLAPGRHARAWRVRVPEGVVQFHDRRMGEQVQDVACEVGDFVLRRADGLWAYQLAVVVDDAAQGVTDVVRGADLLSSTPRQQILQRMLGLPLTRYMHVPVVVNAEGQKLSKQTGATALETATPLTTLQAAWRHLGFDTLACDTPADFLTQATAAWHRRWHAAR